MPTTHFGEKAKKVVSSTNEAGKTEFPHVEKLHYVQSYQLSQNYFPMEQRPKCETQNTDSLSRKHRLQPTSYRY